MRSRAGRDETAAAGTYALHSPPHMAVVRYLADKLTNLVANLGTGRDKSSASCYDIPILSDAEALNMYRGAWLPRKIVDIPALDATRGWRAWQAEQDQISKLEAEEKRLNLQSKVREAIELARLRGGAAIYIGTRDTDTSKPLDPTRIGTGGVQFLTVMDRDRLSPGDEELDPSKAGFGRPKWYTISGTTAQIRIDPSRLVLFYGARVPRQIGAVAGAGVVSQNNWAWGDSVLLAIKSALMNSDNTDANIASLIFEANVDVVHIPDLLSRIDDPVFRSQVMERMQLAATLKGTNGMLVLDTLETYQRNAASMTGLPDVMDRFLQRVSGAADIPATRLLGQSPAGMSATGDSDTRNYYDRINSTQTLDIQPAMSVLDECLIRSALGSRPPELFYAWRPLWQPTAIEQSTIGLNASTVINNLKTSGLFADDPLSRAAENMLTELNIMPGLESAMTEYEAENGGERMDPVEAPVPAAVDPLTGKPTAVAVGDSAPAPLYVQRKVVNTGAILAWAKSQGFKNPTTADDLHVTIAYSTQPVDWMKAGMGGDWGGNDEMGNIRIAPGGARVVEPLGDGGAVVLMFNSSSLAYRNESIREAGASWDYDGYQPHITITYDVGDLDLSKVEPYRGEIVLGPEMFEPLDTDWSASRKE